MDKNIVKKGKLIVIEGLDGSGKATQTELLCKRLKKEGLAPLRLSYPNYDSPSSALVKMYLGKELAQDADGVNPYAAASFYAVDRCADFLKYHKQEYESGALFVSDRYATSNVIYQTTKLPDDQWSEFIDWLDDYEYGKLAVPRPDAVIYLDMSVNVSQKLLSKRYEGDDEKKDIHEADIEFLKKCRKTAVFAADRLGWNIIRCDDGETPYDINKIADDVFNIAMKYLCDK